jgi:hypothetical protein
LYFDHDRSPSALEQTFTSLLLGLETSAALPLPVFNQTPAAEPNKGKCPSSKRYPPSVIPKPLRNSKRMNLKENQKITPYIIALTLMDLIALFTCV